MAEISIVCRGDELVGQTRMGRNLLSRGGLDLSLNFDPKHKPKWTNINLQPPKPHTASASSVLGHAATCNSLRLGVIMRTNSPFPPVNTPAPRSPGDTTIFSWSTNGKNKTRQASLVPPALCN